MDLDKDSRGLVYAILILLLWFTSLTLLLSTAIDRQSWLIIGLEILGRTILHTGLFILGHDAMHHNLAPDNPRINRRIGQIAIWLYAFLSYETCQANHRQHHRQPGQVGDPDFHNGTHIDPVHWYLKFMGEYLSISAQIRFFLYAIVIGLILCIGFKVTLINLIVFILIPLCLSSIQLFFFGTYLPHRHPLEPAVVNHHLQPSTTYQFWSLISCYHFGCYHAEHHRHPQKPWYKLPIAGNFLA